jgi:hypothetical protein
VPDAYPLGIDDEEAIAFSLVIDGDRGDDESAGDVVMYDGTVKLVRRGDGLEVRRAAADEERTLFSDESFWYHAVLLCTAFWIQLVLWSLMAAMLPSFLTVPAIWQVLGILVTTFLFPISIYLDAQFVEDTTDWSPIAPLWAVGGFLRLVNLFVALGYISKRRYVVASSRQQ